MKALKFIIVALFFGVASHLSAQADLNALADAIAEDPGNAAALVQAAVAENPGDVNAIVARLLADFPNLAEEVIYGAINGLPSPSRGDILDLVERAVKLRPGLSAEIVVGARRATARIEGMDAQINELVRDILRRYSMGREIIDDEEVIRISPARP